MRMGSSFNNNSLVIEDSWFYKDPIFTISIGKSSSKIILNWEESLDISWSRLSQYAIPYPYFAAYLYDSMKSFEMIDFINRNMIPMAVGKIAYRNLKK